MLFTWTSTARWFYNQAIAYINECYNNKISLKVWNKAFNEINSLSPDWTKNVPYQIKKIAVKDAFTAYRTNIKLFKKGLISHFKLRFKSKFDTKQTIYIPKSAVNQKGVYHTILGELLYKEKLPKVDRDCRMTMIGGEYYLNIPLTTHPAKAENQGAPARVVAVDLGIRSFATLYTESMVGKIGISTSNVIISKCLKIDKLISEMSNSKKRRAKRLRKVISRLRLKLNHKIDELHKKTAKFLTDNFDIIILPKFEVRQMVLRRADRIRSKSVRAMLSLGFYRFREYLRTRCVEHNKVLVEPSEAYTSKTQSWDGNLVEGLGGSKWIGKGDYQMDRDYNGARGIYLKGIMSLLQHGCILEYNPNSSELGVG